jgi:hypothetical protein
MFTVGAANSVCSPSPFYSLRSAIAFLAVISVIDILAAYF